MFWNIFKQNNNVSLFIGQTQNPELFVTANFENAVKGNSSVDFMEWLHEDYRVLFVRVVTEYVFDKPYSYQLAPVESKTTRQPGHYWCHLRGTVFVQTRWTTCYWDGDAWLVPGFQAKYGDATMKEIDETPVPNSHVIREPGQYWCNIGDPEDSEVDDEWVVCVYGGKYWTVPGYKYNWSSDKMREIDWTPLTRK